MIKPLRGFSKAYDNVFERKFILVGPYPPPRGGISIHIERLLDVLAEAGMDFHLFNHGSYEGRHITATKKKYRWWVGFFLASLIQRRLIRREHVVFHFHLFADLQFAYLLFFTRMVSNRVIITIHNEDLFRRSGPRQQVIVWAVRHMHAAKIITVSKNLNDYLLDIIAGRTSFIPAYIRPRHRNPITIPRPNDSNEEWIACSVWRLREDYVDRYGLDLCFTLLRDFPRLVLFLFVGDKENSDVNLVKNRCTEGVRRRVRVYFDCNLTDYIGNFDLFVRPNRQDGYGVSIVEALDNGVPVLASDTCYRADGTVLFQNGNYGEFKAKTSEMLDKSARQNGALATGLNFENQLLDIYRTVSQS